MSRKATEICSISDCGRSFYAKGLCHSHYERARKGGDVSRPINASKVDVFVDELIAGQWPNECVIWPFAVGSKGYGIWDGSTAHRRICEICHGEPIFDNAEAAHSCNNRICVNPAHIRWATPQENASDKVRFGTHLSTISENNKMCRYDETAIKNVRKMRRFSSYSEIMAATGISKSHIARIVKCQARNTFLRS